jgi:hypothetical protein
MQLKLLQQYLQAFEAFLASPQASQNLYIWESQRIFQENWALDAADWPAMYERALHNSHNRRLWHREAYEPKRMMLELAKMQPDMVRHLFYDLFNEEKSLEGRASRMVYYCDALLEQYRELHPKTRDNSHYHDDGYQMAFLYLAFRYPERYALYDGERFRLLLEKLGSRDLPPAHDLERFAKVCLTLHKLLQKEDKLLALHRRRLREGFHYTGESLLLVYDFYCFVARS